MDANRRLIVSVDRSSKFSFHHQFDRKAMPHSTIGFIIINGKSGIE
ncbi:hypothetical protein AB07_1703 [Citrobacter freundii]|nr:hypothetical protein AB07_1703 [Citrobacter freundii]